MAQSKEDEYVHAVYDEIASHFSQTRYKPWPVVEKFLNEQNIGSIGIDVGCGNGKYLGINHNVFLIGSDRCSGLISCAHELNSDYNVVIADGLNLPHRNGSFDFAISIAVIHHWSTRERRVAAIRHIMSKLRKGAEALFYCWALEQNNSRRGYNENMEQDVLVPWVLQMQNPGHQKPKKEVATDLDLENIAPSERSAHLKKWKREQHNKRRETLKSVKDTSNTRYRYYHLYREGELEEDCKRAGCIVVRNGYEKDNWYLVARNP